MPTGKSGPLAKYINEDIYVSAVGPNQITLATEEELSQSFVKEPEIKKEFTYSSDKKVTETIGKQSFIARIGMGGG